MVWRALVVWLAMLVAAVANGTFRELAITPRIGDHAARFVSSLVLAAIVLLIGQLLTPWIGLRTSRSAWRVGVAWVALTLAFEFVAGHFLFHTTWQQLAADYDLAHGRIWIVVIIATLLAPVLGYRGGVAE